MYDCSIAKQVMVLGSYSNALPGQDSSSGASLPRYRVSEGSTFGSMPDVEWQQLEVRLFWHRNCSHCPQLHIV